MPVLVIPVGTCLLESDLMQHIIDLDEGNRTEFKMGKMNSL